MTDLVDTTEMYLRTILDLEEEQILPMRARISERLTPAPRSRRRSRAWNATDSSWSSLIAGFA